MSWAGPPDQGGQIKSPDQRNKINIGFVALAGSGVPRIKYRWGGATAERAAKNPAQSRTGRGFSVIRTPCGGPRSTAGTFTDLTVDVTTRNVQRPTKRGAAGKNRTGASADAGASPWLPHSATADRGQGRSRQRRGRKASLTPLRRRGTGQFTIWGLSTAPPQGGPGRGKTGRAKARPTADGGDAGGPGREGSGGRRSRGRTTRQAGTPGPPTAHTARNNHPGGDHRRGPPRAARTAQSGAGGGGGPEPQQRAGPRKGQAGGRDANSHAPAGGFKNAAARRPPRADGTTQPKRLDEPRGPRPDQGRDTPGWGRKQPPEQGRPGPPPTGPPKGKAGPGKRPGRAGHGGGPIRAGGREAPIAAGTVWQCRRLCPAHQGEPVAPDRRLRPDGSDADACRPALGSASTVCTRAQPIRRIWISSPGRSRPPHSYT